MISALHECLTINSTIPRLHFPRSKWLLCRTVCLKCLSSLLLNRPSRTRMFLMRGRSSRTRRKEHISQVFYPVVETRHWENLTLIQEPTWWLRGSGVWFPTGYYNHPLTSHPKVRGPVSTFTILVALMIAILAPLRPWFLHPWHREPDHSPSAWPPTAEDLTARLDHCRCS